MKISDSGVRHHMNGYQESSPSYSIASELLQRRREVRRLRKALRDARWICDNDYGTWTALGEVLDAALKPKRGGK